MVWSIEGARLHLSQIRNVQLHQEEDATTFWTNKSHKMCKINKKSLEMEPVQFGALQLRNLVQGVNMSQEVGLHPADVLPTGFRCHEL